MVFIEIISVIVLVIALAICEAASKEHENINKMLKEYEKDLNNH